MNYEKWLRLKRLSHGYSQEELAEILGVSRAAISRWERAIARPSVDILKTLFQLYNCTHEEIVTYINF